MDNNHAVHTAAERNMGEHIHNMLKLENIDVQAAFECACEKDDLTLVKRLAKDRRADAGKVLYGGMILEAGKGDFDVVKLLLADQRVECMVDMVFYI